MHILHLTPYYAPAYAFGGVVRAVEGLANALAQRGHTLTILTTTAHSPAESLPPATTRQGDLTIIRARNWLPLARRVNLSTPFGMQPIAQRLVQQVDVVHLHEFRTVENLLVAPLAAAHHIPIVLSPHGTLAQHTGRSRLKRVWDRTMSPRLAQRIGHVVALAPAELRDCRALWSQWQPQTDLSLIPNGVDLREFADLPDAGIFREMYGLGAARMILFLGRLHRRKGVEVLLRAFLRANLDDARLVFVGPDEGMRSQLEPLADERVIFTGYLESQRRLQALAAADLFALPAVGEGLSMAALEALAAGVPVLLSPGSAVAGVVEAGAGRVVEPETEALAQALIEIWGDAAALQQMRLAARQLVQARYTWEQVAAQMEAVYESLAHER